MGTDTDAEMAPVLPCTWPTRALLALAAVAARCLRQQTKLRATVAEVLPELERLVKESMPHGCCQRDRGGVVAPSGCGCAILDVDACASGNGVGQSRVEGARFPVHIHGWDDVYKHCSRLDVDSIK